MAATIRGWFKACALSTLWSYWNKTNAEADPAQCGRYRADFVIEIDSEQRVVILEYDEHAHSDYPISCELKRQGELALGYGGRPVHIIRYNPDAVPRHRMRRSRAQREDLLLSTLQAALAPTTTLYTDVHHLDVAYLFYPPFPASDGKQTHYADYQKLSFRNIQPDYEAWAERTILALPASAT